MRIHHTALYCKDLEAMRQFFIDHFCAVSNDQYHNPRTTGDGFYETAVLGPEGIQLELTI